MADPPHPVPKLLVSCSNGEFSPGRADPVVAEAGRRAAHAADAASRRLGMDRRRFLRSSLGTATALAALGACRDEAAGPGASAGGSFAVPPEATTDPEAAATTLGPLEEEVVVDVQTHFLDPDTVGFGRGFPQAGCGDDAALCFTIDQWADLVLNGSDTSLAVLSALPVVADDHPMTVEKMEEARRLADVLCSDGRVLLQGEAFPQVGGLDESLERMSALAAEHSLVAWKTYTHTGGGYRLDDEVGAEFLDHIASLAADGTGPDVLAVHKGLGADPADVGPAAAAHPDLRFLAYHSGFETNVTEGPFDEGGAGADRLVRSLRDAGIGSGGNVYCELGSTWKHVMTDPTAAAHLLGKLLVAVGPERILWGTDSVWYGSPQDQIEAFRAFEISQRFQEEFGYPALTAEVKRRILGGNAAALHGIDLASVADPCRFTAEEREASREEAAARLGSLADRTLGPTTPRAARRAFLQGHPWFR